MPKVLSRRTFLRGTGGITVGLPLLSAMQSRPALAAGPKRYVQYGIPHGLYPADWYTASGTKTLSSAPPVKESNFTFKPRMAAMQPHAADTLILRGFGQWGGAEGHHAGTANTFTGSEYYKDPATAKAYFYGVSVDQVIAKTLNHPRFKSLVLGCFAPGVAPGTESNGYGMVFSGENQPINPDNDPKKVFQTLFAGRTGGGGVTALAEAHARRKSILDLVRTDFEDVRTGLGVADKKKLTDHLEGIRSLEIDIANVSAPQDCGSLNPDEFNIPLNETMGDKVMKAQIDLIALAFSCDLTPVASLQGNFSMGSLKYPWLEKVEAGISKDGNHAWTHDRPSKDKYFMAIEQWWLQQLAYLVTRLKELKVFDNTVVLASTNEGRGYHDPGDQEGRNDLTYLLIGSGGGTFKTGRVVDFGVPGWIDPKIVLHHSPPMLNTIAKSFGYTGAPFGNGYRNQAGPNPFLTVNG